MNGLERILDPATVAIAGLSSDLTKHGGRVLGHLRSLGFQGTVWGVNPRLPDVDGVEMYPAVSALPGPPDLVVGAVPAPAALDVVGDSAGAGGVVLFAGGFGESGEAGQEMQAALVRRAAGSSTRVLGPNSGGVIRPSRGLAASFLTCLDRPADEIRTGPVGLVTQSGGTGSYLHNLAAARGSGLAVSVSTGNEVDIRLGEALAAVAALDEVEVVLAVIETVRDGPAFIAAVERATDLHKPVVACRIGTGRRGKTLMRSHTGAMAVPDRVLDGVLAALGVVVADTPAEGFEVAEMMARSPSPRGTRPAVVTHSGGIAILLADLAERYGLELTDPGPHLQEALDPLLDHGVAANPLDMGGIIAGPARFAEVVDAFASSDEYDLVLAVSTAHPPAHTEERVASLLRLETDKPVLHLWMAGDQARAGLDSLRTAGAAVTEEPRAAIRALAGLCRPTAPTHRPGPIAGALEEWGLPLVKGRLAAGDEEAARAAEQIGYPVVVKVHSPGLDHKTEIGGVRLDLRDARAVRVAYQEVTVSAVRAGLEVDGVRVERFRPGLEVIVGALSDPTFGPVVSVGLGGVFTEVLDDVSFAPAPIGEEGARAMIERLRARKALDGFRGAPPADLDSLAGVISLVSRGLVGSDLTEIEINPLVWDGTEWVAVDWLTR